MPRPYRGQSINGQPAPTGVQTKTKPARWAHLDIRSFRLAGAWLAVPGSGQVILGACLARLVCCVDRGQAAGDGRYPGPQFGGLDDLDVRAEPQELGLSVLD